MQVSRAKVRNSEAHTNISWEGSSFPPVPYSALPAIAVPDPRSGTGRRERDRVEVCSDPPPPQLRFWGRLGEVHRSRGKCSLLPKGWLMIPAAEHPGTCAHLAVLVPRCLVWDRRGTTLCAPYGDVTCSPPHPVPSRVTALPHPSPSLRVTGGGGTWRHWSQLETASWCRRTPKQPCRECVAVVTIVWRQLQEGVSHPLTFCTHLLFTGTLTRRRSRSPAFSKRSARRRRGRSSRGWRSSRPCRSRCIRQIRCSQLTCCSRWGLCWCPARHQSTLAAHSHLRRR